jgi:hypothetical protein
LRKAVLLAALAGSAYFVIPGPMIHGAVVAMVVIVLALIGCRLLLFLMYNE